uniref:Uncharacterized protein n=1 Tax=Mesocestoides corti TaxID=53468 RepID=A0A5K3FJM2_MESCO
MFCIRYLILCIRRLRRPSTRGRNTTISYTSKSGSNRNRRRGSRNRFQLRPSKS